MRKISLAALSFCLFASLAIAQTTTGRLLGTVSGPDGLLPGATVTITDTQTQRTQTTVTNESGAYSFERVTFGTYTLRVTASGFKTFEATEVKVDANRDYTYNPTLEIGDISAVVSVTAGADLVNASNSELSTTVSPKQILDLPIDGRNPLSLLNLQAGVNPTAGNHVNGQRTSSTNFTRDGINIQDNFIRTGGFVQDRPNVDDTGEFTVVTQNAGAELGGGGSAQIQLVTPRGGSDFSGAAYIYNRNSYFAANEFGANATGNERPFLNRNQFGGRLGGPMPIPGFGSGTPMFFKDKGFFFFNYERFLLRQQSIKNTRVLLSQFRDGTFTYLDLTPPNMGGPILRTINVLTGEGLDLSDPRNAAVFANAQGVLPLDPTVQQRIFAGTPGTGNGVFRHGGMTQDFAFNQANNDTRNAFTSRFDVDVNPGNSLYFVYKYNDNADDRTDIDNTFNTVPVNTQGGPTSSYILAWVSTPWRSFSNEFRVGYQQSNPFFNEDPNFPTDFVIGGIPAIGGIPLHTNPQSNFQAQGRNTDLYTIQNNSSTTFGNHTIRFGIDFNAQRIKSQTNFTRVPIYSISTTGNPNTPGLTTGAQNDPMNPVPLFPGGISGTDLGRVNSLRYLLGGIVGSGAVAANFQGPEVGPVLGTPSIQKFKYETIGLYVGDSWRATNNLTLNLGLRWDYYSPLRNPDQVYLEPDLTGASGIDELRQRLLDPNGQYVLIGNNAGKPGHFHKRDLDNFGPVLGFAWAPGEQEGLLGTIFGNNGVLRGGFRVGYVNDEYVRGPDNAAGGNPGLDLTVPALQGGSTSLNARFDKLPGFVLPPFEGPPISFATANVNAGNFFNTVFAVDPNVELQRNLQYTFGFQREIGFDTAIEIRYVGGRSDNMVRGIDFNQVQIENGGFLSQFNLARNNCRIAIAVHNSNPDPMTTPRYMDNEGCTTNELRGLTGLPGQVVLDPAGPIYPLLTAGLVRQYVQRGWAGELAVVYIVNGLDGTGGANLRANPNAGVVDILTNRGRYRYDALQTEIRRRFTSGFAFQANYTFGKVLTDIQGDGQTRFDPILDNAQPELEYGRADYDRTHTININANYELPFGNGKRFLNQGGWVDKIFGGWQLTTIINWSSGVPISIRDTNGTLNRAGRSGRQNANSPLTLDEIRSLVGIRIVNGTIYYIDPSVLGPNGAATNGNVEITPDERFPGQIFFKAQPGATGNLPRNFLDGPSYFNIDAGILKNIRFGERFRVQVRAEAFNLLNNTNFLIGENSNIFNVSSTSFGIIAPTSTYDPRIMQFAFRFEF